MAITFDGVATVPADNAANSDATEIITIPTGSGALASAVAGDLVCLVVTQRDGNPALSVLQAAGQTWTAEALVSLSSSAGSRLFWCQFNGTWSSDIVVATSFGIGLAISAQAVVFSPSSPANLWQRDVAQSSGGGTPTTPFDSTATGQTPTAPSTVTLVWWFNTNSTATTWALQTGGWTNPGGQAQYRNTQGTDISVSLAYKIQTSIAATGNVVNRQLTGTGAYTEWAAITFREVSVQDDAPSLFVNIVRHRP